ncbi:U32 family peptidase [Vibrio sp.]|nr:U32 family peptidase [Vibrio sp.]
MELLCPAGSLPALKAAIDNGADTVYIGFKDDTNARHFAGLNFSGRRLENAVNYVQKNRKKLNVAINTFAHPERFSHWSAAVDQAADIGANALIVGDIAVLDYASTKYPSLDLHLSVQASATNRASIEYYTQNFNVKRVVLPRVLSIQQVRQLSEELKDKVEIEVFAFGSLCIMSEGRCYLSSYLTGESPNTVGACSPARFVRWQETEQGLESRLNNILIDRYARGENAGYPTLCKGRFCSAQKENYHALEEPTSLNTLDLLPTLLDAGIASVKIEGRQRSPAYVAQVTKVWREAIDSCKRNSKSFLVQKDWDTSLANLSEGSQTTLGAYQRKWQ